MVVRLFLVALLTSLLGDNTLADATHAADTPRTRLAPRQTTSSAPTLFGAPTTTPAASTPLPPHITPASFTSGLVPTPTVPVANMIGLIVPNPTFQVYTNLSYQFGFVDSGRPSGIAPGWLREVSPVLIMSNRSVAVFSALGTSDPGSNASMAVVGDLLCSSQTVFAFPYSWGFTFHKPGWHMFVVNGTRSQPTIGNDTCFLPLQKQRSFFATYALSVTSYPTSATPLSPPPTDRFTVYVPVTTDPPGPLPSGRPKEKVGLGVGLGIGGMVIGVLVLVLGGWWIRSRRRHKGEALAFSRLSARDQEQFLRDNPDSQLNPYRSSRWSHTAGAIARGQMPTSGPGAPPGPFGEPLQLTHVHHLGPIYHPAQGLALVNPHAAQVATAQRRSFWSRW